MVVYDSKVVEGVYLTGGSIMRLTDGVWKTDGGSYMVESQSKLADIPDAQPGTIAYTAGFKAMWQLDTDGVTWVSVV